jgi:circadian clock protein KaiC
MSAPSALEYRKFIHQLQGFANSEGCMVLLLTVARRNPADSIVDGLIVLEQRRIGLRACRQLEVRKIRGTDFLGGAHPFRITQAGIAVYPRFEVLFARPSVEGHDGDARISTGVPKFDAMIGGGLLTASATLILGPSGSGKTTLGLHFLRNASPAEPALHFGFYEPPLRLRRKALGLGLDLDEVLRRGNLEILWQPPTEQILDELGTRLIDALRSRRAQRLFVDGLSAFFNIAVDPDRLTNFFIGLSTELRALGVTTIYTAETPNVIGGTIDAPVTSIATIFDNLILLSFVEWRAHLHRLLSIVKARDSQFDTSVREFVISKDGIDLADTFKSAEAILSGFAREKLPGEAGTGRPAARSKRAP